MLGYILSLHELCRLGIDSQSSWYTSSYIIGKFVTSPSSSVQDTGSWKQNCKNQNLGWPITYSLYLSVYVHVDYIWSYLWQGCKIFRISNAITYSSIVLIIWVFVHQGLLSRVFDDKESLRKSCHLSNGCDWVIKVKEKTFKSSIWASHGNKLSDISCK